MMMSRPRPDSSTKEEKPKPKVTSAVPKSTEEHLEDIERRLAALGGASGGAPEEMVSTDVEEEVEAPSAVTVEREAAPAPAPAPPAASTAPAATTAQPKGGKNALLARIMAAQERAKMAQQHQQPAAAAAAKDPAEQQQEKIMKALAGETETQDDPPPPFELAQVTPQIAEAPPPPIEEVPAPAPPAFDAVEEKVMQQVAQEGTPSAPPVEQHEEAAPAAAAPTQQQQLDLLDTIDRVVPPPTEEAPPSFEQFEEEAAFDLDIDGHTLSPEERKAMAEEQRKIMEQIQKDKAANDAAIAAAAAESFDQRSNTAAAAAAGGNTSTSTTPVIPPPTTTTEGGSAETAVERPDRTVAIGSGQQVALHGQERTRAAIAAGTAILVQCINCQNWMQVTDSATLMFCPVCQVVSPVQRQNEVLTRDEAVQLQMDRRLAEQLQREMYQDGEQGEGQQEEEAPSLLSRLTGRSTGEESKSAELPQSGQQQGKTQSWWEYLGFGVAEEKQRGEIAVTRPPSSTSPARNQLLSVNTGDNTETVTFTESQNEREGLLSANVNDSGIAASGSSESHSGGNEENLPAARVAERQPFFSCVADSVAGVTSSLSSALTTQTLNEDPEGNIHGVDASGLLAVTQVGRNQGGDGGGDYRAVPNNESM